MSRVRVLILRAPGTNCDVETAFAFEQAGAETTTVHVNQLIRRERRIGEYQVMVIPGGFTYGDDIAAGKVLANEITLKLGDDIKRFVEEGGLILGICNGFQVLLKAGILPSLKPGESPSYTLAQNDSGKFECRWIYLKVNQESPCVFTRDIERMYLPVAHAEGKIVAINNTLPDKCAVLKYTDENGSTGAGYPFNPNGSVNDIAGMCDESGRIFALMPHPERHIRGIQHPRWMRLGLKEYGDGFKVFQNAVKWAENL